MYTLWALLTLGDLFHKGLQVLFPHLGTHFSGPLARRVRPAGGYGQHGIPQAVTMSVQGAE